jgi:hypothetical protein
MAHLLLLLSYHFGARSRALSVTAISLARRVLAPVKTAVQCDGRWWVVAGLD